MPSCHPDLGPSILSLCRLLTQKMNNTDMDPSLFSPYSPTAALNLAIQHELRAIHRHARYPDIGDEEFRDLFRELEELVAGWGTEGGTTMEERARIALIVEDFADA